MAVSTFTNNIATVHSNGSVVDNFTFSIISYNLHGFNQGYIMLSEMCSKFDYNIDRIFIQENWLTPNNLSMLSEFSPNY